MQRLKKEWNKLFKEYASKYPEDAKKWDNYYSEINASLIDSDEFWAWDDALQLQEIFQEALLTD